METETDFKIRKLQEALMRAHNIISSAMYYGITKAWRVDAALLLMNDRKLAVEQGSKPVAGEVQYDRPPYPGVTVT